ncbi:hypothetical protein [Synechococcus lacustris]|uniref:hypothetical protein n=1 Tax=Synechococcus lacustris TaxID=2116544 RepID=UPI0020CE202B|nr:hypothetical protein [Synechococcus lacustris]MCP9812339.1 hypothetical protein [Synechococcus lacustris Maggiore-St4-Slac]
MLGSNRPVLIKSLFFTIFSFLPLPVFAQPTTNSSTLTNSAAPSASSVTTGGTNINYQTNNSYNNENGFGPGVFCRTPILYVGGNYGNSALNNYDPIQGNIPGNVSNNFSANVGIVIPFASQILSSCNQLAYVIARDKEISSQLSMLRLCAQLDREGLIVDPIKYPLLKPCAKTLNTKINQIEADSTPTQPPSPEIRNIQRNRKNIL